MVKRLHFSEYTELTLEMVEEILELASEKNKYLDRLLDRISRDTFEEIKKEIYKLVKDGKLDLTHKIRLDDFPVLYQELKKVERASQQAFINWMWMGEQVIQDCMTQAYKIANVRTNLIYGRPQISPVVHTQITDTAIYQNRVKIPWCKDGKTYSDRIYRNVSQFSNKLAYVLEEGVTNGRGMEWMEKAWRQLTHATAFDTARLLKTEVSAMQNEGMRDAMLDMGIEYIEIVGDAACGTICTEFIGEVLPLREAEIGGDLPPYHPYCVCTFVSYTDGSEEI